MAGSQPSVRRVKSRLLFTRALRRLDSAEWPTATIAAVVSAYLRFVRATSTFVYEPGEPFEMYRDFLPGIATLWHGNLMMVAAFPRPRLPLRILISNHRDGEIAARVAMKSGYGLVRGSGGRTKRWLQKGGLGGFFGLGKSLEEGVSVILTGENHRGGAHTLGLGALTLARTSGKSVIGLGVAARRVVRFNSWDRAVLPLPFNRFAIVPTDPVAVPSEVDDALIEEKRRELEGAIHAATARAGEIVRARR